MHVAAQEVEAGTSSPAISSFVSQAVPCSCGVRHRFWHLLLHDVGQPKCNAQDDWAGHSPFSHGLQ